MKKTIILTIVFILLVITVNAKVLDVWGNNGINKSWADSAGNFWMVNLSAVLYNNISFTTSTEGTTEVLDICLGGSGSDCKFVNKTGMQLTTSTILWFVENFDILTIYTNQTGIKFNQTINFTGNISIGTIQIDGTNNEISINGNPINTTNDLDNRYLKKAVGGSFIGFFEEVDGVTFWTEEFVE